jgi:prepilin-type N-terminal cleavage/methylation domain-containing protein
VKSFERGFALTESLVVMLVGALLLTLFSFSLGGITSGLLKLKERVDSFERASQVFLLIRRDIGEQNLSQLSDSLPKDIDLSRYAGGETLATVYLLRPLEEISGRKGENFFQIINPEIFSGKYISQAWENGDVIGMWIGNALQKFKITRRTDSQIFLTQPLKREVKTGKVGLLIRNFWYVGFEDNKKNKRALYRNQNGINEKMVSGINAFGINKTQSGKASWEIWVDEGRNHYVFS